jgi:hypothetical protein
VLTLGPSEIVPYVIDLVLKDGQAYLAIGSACGTLAEFLEYASRDQWKGSLYYEALLVTNKENLKYSIVLCAREVL